MANTGLWKYFTKEHHRQFVLSLDLLAGTDWPREKQLACLYAVSNHTEHHYKKRRIPKADGSCRELLEPDPLLKSIQRNLLHNVLERHSLSPHATAYRKGMGVLENARPHQGKSLVLNLDIRDFFGSITWLMVYRAAFPAVYYPPSVATLLTHLCCCDDCLPQGAPTSAAISNLVMRPFDAYMGRWCRERGITYTRYCDDMAFSGDFDADLVIRKVRSFLLSLGFELHEGKTKVLRQGQRQRVTGLVVNDRPQVSRAYRDKLRQEIHYCQKYGAESHLAHIAHIAHVAHVAHTAGGDAPTPERYLRSLLGKIHYVLQADPAQPYFAEARDMVRQMLAEISY